MFLDWAGEPNYNVNANGLVTTLDVGDNFVVNVEASNSEGVNFRIICCLKPLHHAQKAFTYKWGTSFEVGDYVASLYYHKWGTNEHSYVLLKDSHLAYFHSQLVRIVKFLMSPKDYKASGNSSVYELSDDTLTSTQLVIAIWRRTKLEMIT
jgi:hypothetical protein